ncbi:hypothetical protein [Streptomyces yaizuensis]|uniref:Uncharacterized protein n=1 Tax=Streptomyces yaizuensis TaxID=2989713 RepID=A0ABQ5P9C5_9ACTN|nr:hypothetical protein [Streptomyces sp. YSPA8]GLF98841.1 hypothetical protein SYYSPA8_31110 [Streptomyces sp. YSPA8]
MASSVAFMLFRPSSRSVTSAGDSVTAYVANNGTTTVSVVDTATDPATGTFTVGSRTSGLAVVNVPQPVITSISPAPPPREGARPEYVTCPPDRGHRGTGA